MASSEFIALEHSSGVSVIRIKRPAKKNALTLPMYSAMTAAFAAAEAAAAGAPNNAVVPGGGAAGEFAARIGGVGGGPAVAVQDVNPATTVTQGTMIPAILETAINTDVPGFVRAVVSQDVRSYDGSRIRGQDCVADI